MTQGESILIIGEINDEKPAAITCELLGIGRKLADDLKWELGILFMGNYITALATNSIACGADKVYLADAPTLADYNSYAFTLTAEGLCRDISPGILLLGQTDMGIDIAPRLVARLSGGLCMDCVGLSVDPETRLMLQTRPVFGGNAHAVMVTRKARPQIATVRAYSFEPAESDPSRQGEIISVPVSAETSVKVKVTERVHQEPEGASLEEARVIVTGGYGMGSAENFEHLNDLAQVIGGAVGATRPACEQHWAATTQLIGQTGKIVRPDLYLAFGVSGAMQHMAGCLSAKCIVAVNNNPEASIFKTAHFGVIGDCNALLSELTAMLNH